MAMCNGLVESLEIRDDGWVQVIINAAQSEKNTELFFIKNLDGDITMVHKRLAQLCLLRDAITRVLPIEIDYDIDAAQGNLINEVIVHPRTSIEWREMNNHVEGVVIGISIMDIGSVPETRPFQDTPDLAGITLLKTDGTILYLLLDLQREEVFTMQAMFRLLQQAHQTRRPVKVCLSSLASRSIVDKNTSDYTSTYFNASSYQINQASGYIESCEWLTVPQDMLDYNYAFIERLSLRYESYDTGEVSAVSHIKVMYTTAPGQTPEGDISDSGIFQPSIQTAWVHCDSPLFPLLQSALKKQLQVKLGLLGDQIHEVELVSQMGSSARPIWICINQSVNESLTEEQSRPIVDLSSSTNSTLNAIKMNMIWKAQGYFNEGIWRFDIQASHYKLTIDGRLPCCGERSDDCRCPLSTTQGLIHCYLKGMHTVELILHDKPIMQPFVLSVYRIR
jgi:hypothetical protein